MSVKRLVNALIVLVVYGFLAGNNGCVMCENVFLGVRGRPEAGGSVVLLLCSASVAWALVAVDLPKLADFVAWTLLAVFAL